MEGAFVVMAVGVGGAHHRYCRDNFATLGDALDWIEDNEEEADIDNVDLYVNGPMKK
jgi:hypothetical protein